MYTYYHLIIYSRMISCFCQANIKKSYFETTSPEPARPENRKPALSTVKMANPLAWYNI